MQDSQISKEEIKEIVDEYDNILFSSAFITEKSKWASDYCIDKLNSKYLEIADLKNLVLALEYKIEACEIELQAEITSRGIDNTHN